MKELEEAKREYLKKGGRIKKLPPEPDKDRHLNPCNSKESSNGVMDWRDYEVE